jgi:hypothetical protein
MLVFQLQNLLSTTNRLVLKFILRVTQNPLRLEGVLFCGKDFDFIGFLDILPSIYNYLFSFHFMSTLFYRMGLSLFLSTLFLYSFASALSVSLRDAKTYHPNQGEQTITPLTVTFDRDSDISSGSYLTLSLPSESRIRFSSKNSQSIAITGTGSQKIAGT